MGSIIVGQKKQKTVDMGNVTIVPNIGVNVANKGGMTAEEKKALVEKIMEMQKDQIVPELRKHGFNDIADITEAQMKEAEKYEQEAARENRLAEIMALPVDERLPLLLAEGYEDEAKKLSEELAAEQEGESSGKAEDTTAEDGEGDKTAESGDGDGETEPEKKVGRPKKSEE